MITLVVAMDLNQGIGFEGELPWGHIPEDMAHFKEVTTGGIVVMGRKTYESIGKPLPNRTNIVLTRDKSFHAEGVVVIHSIDEILKMSESFEVFVIGGGEVYRLFLPHADRIVSTHIRTVYDTDTTFPRFRDEFTVEDIRFKRSRRGVGLIFTDWRREDCS